MGAHIPKVLPSLRRGWDFCIMAQFSEQALKELTGFIEAESRRWVQEYIANRRSTLQRRGIQASGQLRDSFAYTLTKSLSEAVTNTLDLAFEEHGRFVEMKRLNVPAGGSEFLENLAGWIVKKGLFSRFSRGFIQKRKLKTLPPNALNQMAWGIAVKRSKGYRRRAWYAKSKSAAVTDLFNRVAAGLPDIVVDELKRGFAS